MASNSATRARLGNLANKVIHKFRGGTIPDHFVVTPPSPANMVSLFQGGWASRLPLPGVESGPSDLFADPRIQWFLDKTGSAAGKRVLELGPLEGGHSHMLQAAGAERVVAVESNGLAWLKCLAVKETFHLDRVDFLLGDFVRYLQETPSSCDLAVACGVLYHLRDPHELFPLLRRACSGPVMLWTMIWSDRIAQDHPGLLKRFSGARDVTLPSGRTIRLHRHEYRQSILSKGFFGGNASYSEWLSREDLQASIEAAGYKVREIAFDEPRHPNGPAIAMLLDPV